MFVRDVKVKLGGLKKTYSVHPDLKEEFSSFQKPVLFFYHKHMTSCENTSVSGNDRHGVRFIFFLLVKLKKTKSGFS